MTDSRYLRYPNIRDDLLAFVADDDVWLAPVSGGRAWRISADQTQAACPRISPDGSLVTWTSWRDGLPEIYLAGTEQGGSARVSYWSNAATRVRAWSPAGAILATTAAGQPFQHRTWAYAIPVTDGAAGFSQYRRLPFGPVGDIAMDGQATALLTGTTGREPALWKRYRGGTAGRLWAGQALADDGQPDNGPTFRRLLADVPGQFFNPMLIGGRLAFISDHEGTGNLYSCALDGTDLRRHTDHDGFYVRNASTDGERVVYQCAGDLWMLTGLSADSEPQRLDVRLSAPAAGRATRFISADDDLDDLCCDATGQASAVQVRGTVHWVTHREGPARALSVIPGPVARLPRVLGTTGQVVWVVEADGADALEIGPASGADALPGQSPRRIASGQLGWVADLAAAPDGRTVAVAARDGGLLIVDVQSGEVTELARSDSGRVTGLAFAPDSAWLAWSEPGEAPLRRLRLARLADRHVTDLTDGRFVDTDPEFTTDGKYLAFLSRRTFDPVYDAHVFDLAFPYGIRPYLLTLAAATPSPFGPLVGGRPVGSGKDDDHQADSADGDSAGDSGDTDPADDDAASADAGSTGSTGTGPASAGLASTDPASTDPVGTDPAGTRAAGAEADGRDPGAAKADGSGKVKPVVIDLDGLSGRIVSLPVAESLYASLRAVEGGLVWLREPLTGNLGEGRAQPDDQHERPSLEYFDIKRGRCTELLGEVDGFAVSGDGSRLVVRDHHQLFVVPANRKTDPDGDDRVGVDLSRARFLAEPAALWSAAYAEAGRAMRHEFWVPDMADVDWDAVLEQYRPLVDRVSTADEFADLLNEVVAELGTSHAYVSAAGGSRRTGHVAGLLGADIEPGPDGWQIARILPGEASDPRARSPLEAPGTGISAGDVLVAVDGQPVAPAVGPGPLLVGAAGKPVELTVIRASDKKPHRAVVIPLSDERRLRYQDWVAGRRRAVRELSDGRLGYLHVPDMMSEGWSDFHRDLRAEMHKQGLIVDVRANRGGHTSELIVEKLARRVIGWDVPRNARPSSYPQQAPRGPVVAITDESAGSDGDIVTAAIKIMGVGPVVGTRTWGGVIGIAGFHELVDGTSMTFPKYSFWFGELGWGVENYGVDPDVEVLISPDDWAAGTDTQLEAAVALALRALEERPAATPPGTSDRPSRRRPPLPPRPSAG
ncbi:MAG TPA: S41 family peptidase [Streptosporangiaceae bacterium]